MNAKRNKVVLARAGRESAPAPEAQGPHRTVRERYARGMRQAARQASVASDAYASRPAFGSQAPNFRTQRIAVGRGFHN